MCAVLDRWLRYRIDHTVWLDASAFKQIADDVKNGKYTYLCMYAIEAKQNRQPSRGEIEVSFKSPTGTLKFKRHEPH